MKIDWDQIRNSFTRLKKLSGTKANETVVAAGILLRLLKNKKIISLFSHNCETINHSNIAIPVASFYEKSGTYINKDGIKQKMISKISKDTPFETITTIIENLKSMIEKGTL